jgi:hypothetical protein
MRRRLAWSVAAAAVGFLLAGSLRAQDNYQASDPNVDNIVRYARMAVGGGAVSKLKALEFKGKSKVEMNGFLIDCTVDIKILLPEHYLRVDATPTDAKLAGYAGKQDGPECDSVRCESIPSPRQPGPQSSSIQPARRKKR